MQGDEARDARVLSQHVAVQQHALLRGQLEPGGLLHLSEAKTEGP